jgi:hypothetical protein
MRPNPFLRWILLCFAVALVAPASRAQSAPTVAGRIIAARIQGNVTATSTVDKSSRTLHSSDTLAEHTIVITSAGASATLVFSNGAVLNLGADSQLSIDEFLQDPFDQSVTVGDLKEEPTTSVTRVSLARGELVGNVKHLHADRGSSFTVSTPVGVAGIRGTTFRIVFRPDASGKVFFTLTTADGTVVLQHGEAKQEVPVPSGKEVVVTVDAEVDATTGQITLKSAPVVEAAKDMTPESATAVAAAAQTIVEDSSSVIVNAIKSDTGSGETKSDTSSGETEDNSGDQNNGNGDNPTDQNTNPDPTNPSSNTTPGDGQPGT